MAKRRGTARDRIAIMQEAGLRQAALLSQYEVQAVLFASPYEGIKDEFLYEIATLKENREATVHCISASKQDAVLNAHIAGHVLALRRLLMSAPESLQKGDSESGKKSGRARRKGAKP